MRHPKTIPPKLAKQLLLRFLRNDLAEEVQGDLDEKFYAVTKTKSQFRAKLNYWYQVLSYVRPFAVSKSKLNTINHYDMFQNYFKIAWRNLLKQKMYSAIKIGGFALGIAVCILIALFIRSELSHDKFYADGNRIFRMYNNYTGDDDKWTAFPAPVAQLVKNDFPEVEKSGRLIPFKWYKAGSNLFRREDQVENTYEEGFAYADQSLLEILEIPMIYGSQSQALSKPNTIILSKSKAEKYFPGENPVGRTIIFNENKERPYTIGGVYEDFSPLSHLDFKFLITLTNEEFWPGEQTSWCCWNYNVYLKLRPDASAVDLEKKLLKLRDTYYVSHLEKVGDQSLEDVKKYHTFILQPVSDIYLKSDGIHDAIKHGDMQYVWVFGGVACFILLLACINFINLSTARSANRAKEVGLRKTVGSHRSHLIRQFLTESLLFSLISFVLGIAIATAVLPYFNVVADKQLTIPITAWWFIPMILMAVVVIGVLAGMYPSFYLSAFKPIDVLKGSISLGTRNSTMRSVMVVFQFATSIALIIGTFIIYKQMNFILNTKIGFDKEQVILLEGANTLGNDQRTFKDELSKFAQVQNVTITDYLPVSNTRRDQNQFWRYGKSKEEKAIGAQKWYADVAYINTLGMRLAEGRNFDEKIASDTQAIIINQTMAKEFGFRNPTGERIMNNNRTYTIIGVVEDFNFESLRGNVEPLCLAFGNFGSVVAIKVKSEDMKGALQSITTLWNQFMPHQPIRYSFLDESYARMYDDVQRMGSIFTSFSILAIIVACLGLFALSTFMVEQRGKEISIRIVLGASLNSIFRLLTGNFVKLVLIAFAIAVPIGWYMMQKWLQDYQNRIEIGWDVFIIAGLMTLLIAVLTISQQAIKAALTNPVKNLKSE